MYYEYVRTYEKLQKLCKYFVYTYKKSKQAFNMFNDKPVSVTVRFSPKLKYIS
jgi:hypothetical protein